MRTAYLLILLSLVIGLVTYGIYSAKAHSYLLDDPAACANCHVMQKQYHSYLASPHANVTVCNDCHTPAGLIPKYLTKSLNGISHSFAFTTGRFADPIHIGRRNRAVAEAACLKCHNEVFAGHAGSEEPDNCITCHRNIGH